MEENRSNAENEPTNLEPDSDETAMQTEQIRGKIEETRQEMSETIDAIQEKLSITNISEQVTEQVSEQISNVYQTAKETVYNSTLGKMGKIMKNMNQELQRSNFYHTMANNPLPLFLIALGGGLLLFGSNKRGKYYTGKQTRRFSDKTIKNRRGNMLDSLTETASSAYNSLSETAESAYNNVTDTAGKTYDKLGDLSISAQEKYEYYLEEKPIAVGAIALAAGAAIGMMLPTTQYEEDLMGETSRNLLNKAQTKTQETVDTLKSVAGQAVETVREEVNNYQKNYTA